MRYLLFPFRWADEKVQGAVDRAAFRLMDHLRCERRALVLMLSLVMTVAFVPLTVLVLAGQDSFLGFVLMALFFGWGGRNALTMHAAEDRSIHPWRHYVFARVMVAAMKLAIAVGLIWTLTFSALPAPMAVSLVVGFLAILANAYVLRTPLSRPIEEGAEPAPVPKTAPAEP